MSAEFAAVALGSNLGDRRAHLKCAIDRLADVFSDIAVSRFIETDPVGVEDEQPPYLNAALVGKTTLAPRELLARLLSIEQERGRVRSTRNAARTLDLDLILYGSVIAQEPDLVVPHPRFRERLFVLGPLAEIAPAWRDPLTGLSVAQLHAALVAKEKGREP